MFRSIFSTTLPAKTDFTVYKQNKCTKKLDPAPQYWLANTVTNILFILRARQTAVSTRLQRGDFSRSLRAPHSLTLRMCAVPVWPMRSAGLASSSRRSFSSPDNQDVHKLLPCVDHHDGSSGNKIGQHCDILLMDFSFIFMYSQLFAFYSSGLGSCS